MMAPRTGAYYIYDVIKGPKSIFCPGPHKISRRPCVWPEIFFQFRSVEERYLLFSISETMLAVRCWWKSCDLASGENRLKFSNFLNCRAGLWSKTCFCIFKSLKGSGLIFLGLGSSEEQQPDVVDIGSFSRQNKSSKACKIAETWTQDSERLNNTNLMYWCVPTLLFN